MSFSELAQKAVCWRENSPRSMRAVRVRSQKLLPYLLPYFVELENCFSTNEDTFIALEVAKLTFLTHWRTLSWISS